MIFTFGSGHECACGRPLSNCYTQLDAVGEETARDRMFKYWGRRWSFEYKDEEAAGVAKWSLRFVETNTTDLSRCPCGAEPLRPVEDKPRPSDRMMLFWFGRSWGAPICNEKHRVPTPVDLCCFKCERPIETGDEGFMPMHADSSGWIRAPWHRACFLESLGINEGSSNG